MSQKIEAKMVFPIDLFETQSFFSLEKKYEVPNIEGMSNRRDTICQKITDDRLKSIIDIINRYLVMFMP